LSQNLRFSVGFHRFPRCGRSCDRERVESTA
jgi:hypothetical protein